MFRLTVGTMILLAVFALTSCGTQKGIIKSPTLGGKIDLPAPPSEIDLPKVRILSKGKCVDAEGVFFSRSNFSLLEYNLRCLRTWISGATAEVEKHNRIIDDEIKQVEERNKKKSWYKF